LIRVDALEKSYQGSRVLDGVSFAVRAGGTAAIIGPSGGGKSTLLRCLVGLERFDRGSVRVEDTLLRAGDRQGDAHGRVGLVFQSFELFANLSVLDNCTLAPIKVQRRPRAEAEEAARRLLQSLGLEGKEAAYPDHLSGGQRQRVAIARALCMGPRVLLYDEPTSALDPSLKQEVRDTIRTIAATGVTQVVVTHDVALAHEVAEAVFLLERGRMGEAHNKSQAEGVEVIEPGTG
jgi:ABC-type polar amino acid transport system ATPase subunit